MKRAKRTSTLVGVLLSVACASAQTTSSLPINTPVSVLSTNSTDAIKAVASAEPLQAIKKYYNKNRKEVKDPTQATLYRDYIKIAEKLFQVCEYTIDNKPTMELYVTSIAYDTKNGPARLYYEDGRTIDQEGFFKNDNQDGKWFYYHRNGLLSGREIYEDGLLTDAEYWNEDGSPLKDITLAVKEKPSFPYGDAEIDKFVQKNIELPAEVVKKQITGKTVVSFWVEPDGSITEPKIMLSLHPELDEAVFKVLDKMPKWIPAKQHNRLIRAKFTMPVTITIRK